MSRIMNVYANGHDSNVYPPGDSGITAQDVKLISSSVGEVYAQVVIPEEGLTIELRGEGAFNYPDNATSFADVTGVMYKGYTFFNGVLVTVESYSDGADPVKVGFDFEYIKSLLVGDDQFYGSSASDQQDEQMGLDGNDVYAGFGDGTSNGGSSGRDRFFGGDGTDTAIYRGEFSQYTIKSIDYMWDSRADDGSRINGLEVFDNVANRDGTDELNEVERLQFSDVTLALDTAKGEIAGSAYRIYKAAFDRSPDAGGLGFWINAMDDGASLTSVAAGFINSPEFQKLYGANVSDRDYVTKLYNNVLDRNPDQGGYDFWLGALANGATREDILVNFSESKENIANVADLIANGIQYEAWVG